MVTTDETHNRIIVRFHARGNTRVWSGAPIRLWAGIDRYRRWWKRYRYIHVCCIGKWIFGISRECDNDASGHAFNHGCVRPAEKQRIGNDAACRRRYRLILYRQATDRR